MAIQQGFKEDNFGLQDIEFMGDAQHMKQSVQLNTDTPCASYSPVL